jgi:hypothetical protein
VTAAHEVVTARIEALFGSAMRADPVAISAGLDLLTGTLDPYSLDFLRRSRTTVLACGAALTGVRESHRLTVGDRCLSCGTSGMCRTLREVSRVFEAYLRA